MTGREGKRTHVFHEQRGQRSEEGRGHSYRRFHTHVGKMVALSDAPMNNLESFARAENRSPIERKERWTGRIRPQPPLSSRSLFFSPRKGAATRLDRQAWKGDDKERIIEEWRTRKEAGKVRERVNGKKPRAPRRSCLRLSVPSRSLSRSFCGMRARHVLERSHDFVSRSN